MPIALATIAAIVLIGSGVLLVRERSDAVSVERQIRTTRTALDNMVSRLAQQQQIAAVWDDAIVQLRRSPRNWRWFDDNIGTWLKTMFHHDRVYILDPRDEAIYASEDGARVPAGRFAAVRPDVQRLIDVVRARVRESNHRFDRHPAQPREGETSQTTNIVIHDTVLATIGGRPAVASAMLMRPHTNGVAADPGPPHVMVNVRFLNADFLAELETRDLIESPRLSSAPDPGPGEQVLPLINDRGETIGAFIWRPELPGTRIMAILVPLTAAGVGALVLLMIWLGRRLSRSTGALHDMMIELRASEAQAQHLAFHDALTGLPNRALFNDRVDHALAAVRRGGGLALLMLDLDRFKHVNDTLGHLAGDALIREFGMRMAGLLRDGDTVARLGGDEFAILLPTMDRQEDVENLCGRILAAVHERFEVLGNSAFVGVSIGVVMAPESGLDRTELVRKADIALYRAKEEGRDCHRLFSQCMDDRIRFRSAIEDDLRAALENGDELLVHYQPEVGSDGKTIVGLEALVRWQHPGRGLIPPETFVPVAEESGLICQLGEWVLTQACVTARRWPRLFVAVNLSPVQFRATGFAERAIDIIRSAGVDPGQIELEVTEGVLLDDDELVRAALAKLRAAGIRIALDDFGTGYSSFSYLRRFEVDKIKIDRSFVQHLGHRVDSASIVSAVVSIGHAMGLTVTAEGVETNEQKKFLKIAGCNQMQGYLFSRALPEEEVAALLDTVQPSRNAA